MEPHDWRKSEFGSSPRVRGTAETGGPESVFVRFIPACAGNRQCGRLCVMPPGGSSPRVRGTEPGPMPGVPASRFIPACAGNRAWANAWRTCIAVHPRVCGEQDAIGRPYTPDFGSFPRVRGTGRTVDDTPHARRFIPACAGNRRLTVEPALQRPVHPRVCGEQRGVSRRKSIGNGSSPRVRGTEWKGNGYVSNRRFIPACAGNRAAAACVHCRISVHPRVCGEQSISRWATRRRTGSSPRVRGTDLPGGRDVLEHRFIPACAGNR